MILEITVLTPIVVGVVEVLKRSLKIDNDMQPLTSLITGLVLAIIGFFLLPEGLLLGEALFVGLISGLSAAGLYDNGKMALAKR